MRKQQKIWDKEHKGKDSLPSMASEGPSSGVVSFVNYLKEHAITPPKKLIDIGCGKGRNSIYLVKEGYEVYAVDYVERAINHAKQIAEKEGVLDKIHFLKAEIDNKWPFENNFFDLALDCFSSIDIETKEGRNVYRDEMLRTLKPGGLALVTVVSVNDEWEAQLIKESPGQEKNSTIWPQNGKFQKNYDEEELGEFYKDFEILELKEVSKKAFKLGKEYMATNYWLVLKKP